MNIYGFEVLLDEEDIERVSKESWHVINTGSYLLREKDKLIYFRSTKLKTALHRFIMGAKRGEVVDHKNRNTLDNRKSNLRITTTALNAHNSKIYASNKTGCPGVQRSGKKWRAEIKINKNRVSLGSFETFEQAAAAYWKKKAEFLP